MNRPYCIGLTGGIGSGKSRVANLFEQLGATLIDTDLIARTLTRPSGAAIEPIRTAFGPDYLTPDQGLDRPKMRARIFADPDARAHLEAILHPLIRAQAEADLGQAKRTGANAAYAILVVPLLLEAGTYQTLIDRLLVVDCLPEQQRERVQRRDKLSLAEIDAILASQTTRARRLEAADDVIDNHTDGDHLERQVERLHARYLDLARGRATR